MEQLIELLKQFESRNKHLIDVSIKIYPDGSGHVENMDKPIKKENKRMYQFDNFDELKKVLKGEQFEY